MEPQPTREPRDPWFPPQLAALPHAVIVGGGFGGLRAARELVKARVRVTLIDRQNHHLFQPLLYQVAMAGLSPADIATPIRSIFQGRKNVRVWLGEVSAVSLAQRRVTLRDGQSTDYDYLVLAAGARTNYFGHEESWRPHALPLKKLDHAVEIRRRVLLAFEAAERELDAQARQRLLTFVVIGGGPTGVEVAGALAELAKRVLADDFRLARPESARVILIEAIDRLLPGFDDELAREAVRELGVLGVEVRLSSPVENIDESGVHAGNESIAAATVLWTAGVRSPELAEHLGVQLTRAGRVSVEQDCSLPGHPEVFVIGDMAHFASDAEGKPLPGLAPVAMQQGTYVGRAISARVRGKPKLTPFSYRDRGMMATIGRSRAVLQTGRLKLAGFVAWLLWIVIHVWYLIGFRNRVAVMLNWAWNYLTYRQGARLITGGKEPDRLRQLQAGAERKLTNGNGAARVSPMASVRR
jgi:NADH dehydrogenase